MGEAASAGAVCEVCAKSVPRRDDLLCSDCSRAFTLMLELLHGHPEVDVEDLDRIRDLFQWRMRKKGLLPSRPEVQEEERVLLAALSALRRKQANTAQESGAAKVPAE